MAEKWFMQILAHKSMVKNNRKRHHFSKSDKTEIRHRPDSEPTLMERSEHNRGLNRQEIKFNLCYPRQFRRFQCITQFNVLYEKSHMFRFTVLLSCQWDRCGSNKDYNKHTTRHRINTYPSSSSASARSVELVPSSQSHSSLSCTRLAV